MSTLEPVDDLVILSVAFGPTGVEISYQETRKSSPLGEHYETLLIKDQRYEAAINDIHTSAAELVDQYLVDERNPPERIRTRRSRSGSED